MKKLFIKTYGCSMNVYDSVKIKDLLEPLGFKETIDLNEADMVILNTCAIREKASEKVYSELGRIKKVKDERKKHGKEMIIAVAGCVGQAEGEVIFTRAPYVDVVVGPQSYHSLPKLLMQLARHERNLIELDFVDEAKFDLLPTETSYQGISSNISVQEGCDKFCTFCIVPYTRGAEFSRSVEPIYREASKAASFGAKEIILLGQNVNAYHGKTEDGIEFSLARLISHIASISSIERIRYLTSHPLEMTQDLIALHGSEAKLMPFLHLPIQSGSDKILKAMNRKHTKEQYLDIIYQLKAARPDMVFSSDFIVGFPGETDEDFADTLDVVQRVGYAQCYSFKYSPRPGTPAALKEQVPENVKSQRLKILQEKLSKSQYQFNKSCIGKIMPVLFDRVNESRGQMLGKTPYMQSVHIKDSISDNKSIVDVLITEAFASSLTGEVLSNRTLKRKFA